MKRFTALLTTLVLSCLLVACGSKMYQITTKSGDIYMTKGEPDYDIKSKTYKFENKEGREVILRQDDIKVIQESKD